MFINQDANRQKFLKIFKNVFFNLEHEISLTKMGCEHDQMIWPFFDPLPPIPNNTLVKNNFVNTLTNENNSLF